MSYPLRRTLPYRRRVVPASGRAVLKCIVVTAVTVTFGCHSGTEQQQRVHSPAAAVSTANVPTNAHTSPETAHEPDTLPGTLFADLERAVAPIHGKLEA